LTKLLMKNPTKSSRKEEIIKFMEAKNINLPAKRTKVYKEMMENIPLPPQPILTRWGTWIEAALFYAEHIGKFKNVVQSIQSVYSRLSTTF
jgi:hypothetical protein